VIDFASLFEIAAYTALVVAPAVLLNRLLAGGEGPTLADVFAIPVDPARPRGVQEEEPLRWRLELLDRRPIVADPVVDGCRPRGVRHPAAPGRIGVG